MGPLILSDVGSVLYVRSRTQTSEWARAGWMIPKLQRACSVLIFSVERLPLLHWPLGLNSRSSQERRHVSVSVGSYFCLFKTLNYNWPGRFSGRRVAILSGAHITACESEPVSWLPPHGTVLLRVNISFHFSVGAHQCSVSEESMSSGRRSEESGATESGVRAASVRSTQREPCWCFLAPSLGFIVLPFVIIYFSSLLSSNFSVPT